MSIILLEWASLFTRWFHFTAGVAWIGASFYFIWVENSINRKAESQRSNEILGHLWAVHGGGFYYLEKYKTGPDHIPPHLYWFKWEAYATLFSGFLLMIIVYYTNAQTWLLLSDSGLSSEVGIAISLTTIFLGLVFYLTLCATPLLRKPIVMSIIGLLLAILLVYLLRYVFTPRAAMIHLGATIGTIMVANVFLVIIPGQRLLVKMVETGQKPDPALVHRGVLRSTHNNYLTLPVLFMMISSHYPASYTHEYWIIILILLIVGSVLIRHSFNLHNNHRKYFGYATSGVLVLLMAVMVSLPWKDLLTLDEDLAAVDFDNVRSIINRHCVSCHAPNPIDPLFQAGPPLGFILHTDDLIRQNAALIYQRTNIDRSMPFNNQSNMSERERDELAAWFKKINQAN